MPRKRDPNKKVQLTVRVQPELRSRMEQAAGNDDVSLSELVGRAVKAYLSEDEDDARLTA